MRFHSSMHSNSHHRNIQEIVVRDREEEVSLHAKILYTIDSYI